MYINGCGLECWFQKSFPYDPGAELWIIFAFLTLVLSAESANCRGRAQVGWNRPPAAKGGAVNRGAPWWDVWFVVRLSCDAPFLPSLKRSHHSEPSHSMQNRNEKRLKKRNLSLIIGDIVPSWRCGKNSSLKHRAGHLRRWSLMQGLFVKFRLITMD